MQPSALRLAALRPTVARSFQQSARRNFVGDGSKSAHPQPKADGRSAYEEFTDRSALARPDVARCSWMSEPRLILACALCSRPPLTGGSPWRSSREYAGDSAFGGNPTAPTGSSPLLSSPPASIWAIIAGAFGGAGWYLTRLARSPDGEPLLRV